MQTIKINITNHAYDRYIERILNIKDKKEQSNYLTKNRSQITESINELFTKSDFVYKGIIVDFPLNNYYITDNILLVVNGDNNALKTLWKIDYGFGIDELNKKIINTLKENTCELDRKVEILKENIASDKLLAENKLNNIISEIEYHTQMIEVLEKEKRTTEANLKSLDKDIESTNLERKKLVTKLCYCFQYKRDFERDEGNK